MITKIIISIPNLFVSNFVNRCLVDFHMDTGSIVPLVRFIPYTDDIEMYQGICADRIIFVGKVPLDVMKIYPDAVFIN